jgi:uncharacterized hydrophobic protein (TIGR00271 family)
MNGTGVGDRVGTGADVALAVGVEPDALPPVLPHAAKLKMARNIKTMPILLEIEVVLYFNLAHSVTTLQHDMTVFRSRQPKIKVIVSWSKVIESGTIKVDFLQDDHLSSHFHFGGFMTANSQPALFSKLGFDPAYLPAFEDKLFIEGPRTARRLTNFFALLSFSTVIATYGVLSNSTATVIGAMLVAPLMEPMMATAAAVVMGSLPRALRAFALAGAGAVSVILFSYLLSWVVPDVTISFLSVGEITSRIHPGLYALLTALAAGAAGAFITSRAEIAEALGGVAIAIALVPPLCVVGIALRQGQLDAAAGASLLFLTNFLAILLAGGVVLLVLGLGQTVVSQEQERFRRSAFLLMMVGLLLVTIPLSLTAYQNITSARENAQATAEVQQWLAGTYYRVDTVNANDGVVMVTVEGNGPLKPPQQLANQLAVELGHPVVVELHVLPVQRVKSNNP